MSRLEPGAVQLMRRHRASQLAATGVAAALAAAACAPDPTELFLGLPPLDGAKAEILAIQDGTGATIVRAIDLGGDGVLRFPVEVAGAGAARVEAWVYDQPLDALGLSSGVLQPAAAGTALPLPRAAYAVDIEEGSDALSWAARDAAATQLASFRTAFSGSPCTSFIASVVDLREDTEIELAAAAGPGRLLIGFDDRRLMTLDEGARLSTVTPSLAGVHLAGVFAAPDGTYWFGGRYGELYRGRLAGQRLELEALAKSPAGSRLYRLDGAVLPNGDMELFALGDDKLMRYAAGTWTLLRELGRGAFDRGGLARVGPDEALVAWPRSSSALRYRGGAFAEEKTGADAGLTALADIPGVGIVAASGRGELFVRESGGWRRLDGRTSQLGVVALAPYAGGFLYAGEFGTLGQYRAGFPLCPLENLVGHFVNRIGALGPDTVALLGHSQTEQSVRITLLSAER